jgi:hypothetical protein
MSLNDPVEKESPLTAEEKIFTGKHHHKPEVSEEEKHLGISKIAHELWEKRGGGDSSLEEKQGDWRTAKQLWGEQNSCQEDFTE